ncbi:Calvin cycle protein CP12-3- chloroplastic [Striga hermonthica]|uniref:Calvin cycle protein CP12-3- chloroplastic n=1 Tax=Striga hermonthica TaxID=68872 RepID=A0A9N7NMK0_STRHE|nr:Calvin cycle protein CP12-3- chloroplastic [Striga hermonthica]
MASSFARTALNPNPSTHLPSSPTPRRRTAAMAIRSEMKVYRGTWMREQRLAEMIERKVTEAKRVCGEDAASDECKVAWDEVEEVSQAKADLRLKIQILGRDPLEHFCRENPETDECRIHEG